MFLEGLLRYPGYWLSRLFGRRWDIESGRVLLLGLLFWLAVGGLIA